MIAGITDKKVIGNCKAICKELKSDAAEMSKEAEFLHTALYLVCFLRPKLVYFDSLDNMIPIYSLMKLRMTKENKTRNSMLYWIRKSH